MAAQILQEEHEEGPSRSEESNCEDLLGVMEFITPACGELKT